MTLSLASPANQRRADNRWNTLVTALWSAVLIGICIRIGVLSLDEGVVGNYGDGGRKWIGSQPLYAYTRGFVYSPLIAALFAPFSSFPHSFGGILWRLLTCTVLLAGVFWWLKEELHTGIPKARYWLVFLLILPLSLGNFNNGQANPLVTGLLMIAIVSAHRRRWTISALCLGVTAYLKIYPLAVGLLLVLLYPRQLGLRLLVTLLWMGALSSVLQEPAYVLEQYRIWFATRAADDPRATMDLPPSKSRILLLHVTVIPTA